MRSVSSAMVGPAALAIGFYTFIFPFTASGQTTCPALLNEQCSAKCVCGSNLLCVNNTCQLSPDPSSNSNSSSSSSPNSVFACKFTSGKLTGTTDLPALSGPVNAPCTDNFGSSGTQISAVFACHFSQGPMAEQTIVPTGITLFGPVGQSCTDNYGNIGTQVISP